MATDRTESARRGQSLAKTTTKHPYAAIEHRVIDSAAYAALSFSARSLLVLITRQLTKDNNGHLQATFSYMKRFGFGSERTLVRVIAELVASGFIYRTRTGGYQQGAAQYAVTWLPVKNRQNLFMDGFKSCAWRDWKPDEKKSPPAKMQDTHCKNGTWTHAAHAKNAVSRGAKSADNELIPCSAVNSEHSAARSRLRKPLTSTLAIRLSLTSDRGHLRLVA